MICVGMICVGSRVRIKRGRRQIDASYIGRCGKVVKSYGGNALLIQLDESCILDGWVVAAEYRTYGEHQHGAFNLDELELEEILIPIPEDATFKPCLICMGQRLGGGYTLTSSVAIIGCGHPNPICCSCKSIAARFVTKQCKHPDHSIRRTTELSYNEEWAARERQALRKLWSGNNR